MRTSIVFLTNKYKKYSDSKEEIRLMSYEILILYLFMQRNNQLLITIADILEEIIKETDALEIE